jgi:hypothetical protein
VGGAVVVSRKLVASSYPGVVEWVWWSRRGWSRQGRRAGQGKAAWHAGPAVSSSTLSRDDRGLNAKCTSVCARSVSTFGAAGIGAEIQATLNKTNVLKSTVVLISKLDVRLE